MILTAQQAQQAQEAALQCHAEFRKRELKTFETAIRGAVSKGLFDTLVCLQAPATEETLKVLDRLGYRLEATRVTYKVSWRAQ